MEPRPDRFGDVEGGWQKVKSPASEDKTNDWNPKPIKGQSD